MQSFARGVISDGDIARLYEWAERSPTAVLKCTCRQVHHMKALSSVAHAIGGRDIFLHNQHPGLIAEVCGMVVAVTPKEDQVTYEVDDGTSVLRVLETRSSLQQKGRRHLQAGPTDMARCGIPACYVMPPPTKASSSANSFDGASSRFPPLDARFNVADIVKCTGRIQLDRSGDRFIAVQHIALCEDISDECHHQIHAIKFENEVYRKPFDWSRIDSINMAPSNDSIYQKAAARTTARLSSSALRFNDKAMPAPTIGLDDAQRAGMKRERLSRHEARRLLTGDHSFSHRSLSQRKTVSQPKSSRGTSRILNGSKVR